MFIKEANLFNGLSQGCLSGLGKIMHEQNYSKGEYIFNQGDPADIFYVLEEGTIRLSIGDMGHIVYILDDPGSAFGWSSLVGRDCYTAAAECVTDCSVIKIDKEKLESFFAAHLPDGVLFYKRLADSIGERLLNCYATLLTFQHMEAEPSYG
jgi:CRP-like cAMP-binding protein